MLTQVAYGFEVHPVGPAAAYLVDVEGSGYPSLRLSIGDDVPEGADVVWVSVTERVRLALDPVGRRGSLVGDLAEAEELLVHPALALAAALAAQPIGREVVHAGAFGRASGAWAVLGDKGSGKSTTLAYLTTRGVPSLTDDVCVIDGRRLFAGPACLDLREPTRHGLGLEERTVPVRGGERFRLASPNRDPERPLLGWFRLAWGDRLEICELEPAERLRTLAGVRVVPIEEPRGILELASVPAWELRRPEGLGSLAAAADLLLTTIDAREPRIVE